MAEARRPGTRARPRTQPPQDDGTRQGGSGSAATTHGGSGEAESGGQPPLCSIAFCPICTFVTAMGDVRPELIEHLILASREALLAVRAVIDARLESMP